MGRPARNKAPATTNSMFQRLKQKWKVDGVQLLLILCTFAIGGSLTGYAGRKLMNLIPIEKGWLWVLIYIIIITILWPLAVLLVSLFFGQFRFFVHYLEKIGRRMGLGSRQPNSNIQLHLNKKTFDSGSPRSIHLAIFASGSTLR